MAVEIDAILSPVGVPSCNDVYFARDIHDTTWILKFAPTQNLFADTLGLLLAKEMGIPAPEVHAANIRPKDIPDECSHNRAIAIALVEPASHSALEEWNHLQNQEVLGQVLALDVILAVAGRHAENLLIQFDEQGASRLVVIDFDNAEIAIPCPMLEDNHRIVEGPSIKRPHDRSVEIAAIAMATRFESLSDVKINDITKVSAEQSGIEVGYQATTELLRERCRIATELVRRSLNQ